MSVRKNILALIPLVSFFGSEHAGNAAKRQADDTDTSRFSELPRKKFHTSCRQETRWIHKPGSPDGRLQGGGALQLDVSRQSRDASASQEGGLPAATHRQQQQQPVKSVWQPLPVSSSESDVLAWLKDRRARACLDEQRAPGLKVLMCVDGLAVRVPANYVNLSDAAACYLPEDLPLEMANCSVKHGIVVFTGQKAAAAFDLVKRIKKTLPDVRYEDFAAQRVTDNRCGNPAVYIRRLRIARRVSDAKAALRYLRGSKPDAVLMHAGYSLGIYYAACDYIHPTMLPARIRVCLPTAASDVGRTAVIFEGKPYWVQEQNNPISGNKLHCVTPDRTYFVFNPMTHNPLSAQQLRTCSEQQMLSIFESLLQQLQQLHRSGVIHGRITLDAVAAGAVNAKEPFAVLLHPEGEREENRSPAGPLTAKDRLNDICSLVQLFLSCVRADDERHHAARLPAFDLIRKRDGTKVSAGAGSLATTQAAPAISAMTEVGSGFGDVGN